MTLPTGEDQGAFLQVLRRAAAGDPDARNELFDRFYPRVAAMTHQRLGRAFRERRPWLASRFSTGDVVQEVFFALMRDLRRYEGTSEDAFVGYVSTLIRNRIVDAIRFHESSPRDGRRTEFPAGDTGARPWTPVMSKQRTPDRTVSDREAVHRLRTALRSLSEREQLLVRGRAEFDESFEELAEALGYPSRFAARRAFLAAQATLAARARRLRLGNE